MRRMHRLSAWVMALILAFGFAAFAEGESKIVMGYCESDPYVEFDTQLYYLLLGMEEYGLIRGISDKIESDMTAAEMWGIAAGSDDHAWKISFSGDVYVSLIEKKYSSLSEADQSALIDGMIEDAGVNLMLTMGTSAGLAIAALESGVPLINFVAADPFKSGIVNNTATSEITNRWAHVDVDAFGRTIQVMDDVFHPDSVGVVYADNSEAYIYSGADVLDEFCREHGITVYKQFVNDEFDDDMYENYVQEMHDAHSALADKVDVYILTTSLLDAEDFAYALEPLFEAKVPVYSINSSYDVECGALLAAEASDFPNIGRFGADTIRRYIGGEPLETLPQIYQTAPFLVINYDTARLIGYKPTFEMLLSASKIYASQE